MKTLFLNRHAKSSWDSDAVRDFDRPLNARGKKNAPEMGRRLAKRQEHFDLIISSPAKRAIETAKSIAKEVDYPLSSILEDRNIYSGGTDEVISIIHTLDDTLESAILFGHNPTFTALVNLLTDVNLDNMPTCGIAKISFPITSWKSAKKGTLVYFDYPRNNTPIS